MKIKDLKRFVKSRLRLNDDVDWVDFKVIGKDCYMVKDWKWARHVRITFRRSVEKPFEVTDFGNNVFSEMREWEFNTLEEALNFILDRFPQEFHIYYYHVPRVEYPEDWYNVRQLFGFTVDEAEAWKVILARSMGHLNGRILVGFRKLKNTSKKCSRCRKGKAAVQMVFDYHRRKYGVYYCRECFIKKVYSLWADLLKEAGRIKDRMLELVEPPISELEKKEIEKYLATVDEDLQYMKELGILGE